MPGVWVNERLAFVSLLLGSNNSLRIDRFRVETRYFGTGYPCADGRAAPAADSDSRRLYLGNDEPDFRREFESRLAAMTATHHAEIEALQREMEDLRDRVEEFRDQLRKFESSPT